MFEHCGKSVQCLMYLMIISGGLTLNMLIVRFVIRRFKILTNFGGIRCLSTIKLKAHGFVKSVLKVHSFLNLHMKNMSKPSIEYFAWKINKPYFLRLLVYLLFFSFLSLLQKNCRDMSPVYQWFHRPCLFTCPICKSRVNIYFIIQRTIWKVMFYQFMKNV